MKKNLLLNSLTALVVLALTGCASIQGTDKKSDKQADAPTDKLPTPALKFGPYAAPPPAPKEPTPAVPAGEARIFSGTGAMVKQTPVTTPEVPGPEEVVLNFEGVDIRQVIETILSTYLREPYLVNPSVTGTVSFRTTKGIPKKDLIPTLEMLLRTNGFALVREDGMYKILPFQQVRGSVTPQLGGTSTPLPSGFSILVVPLKYIGAKAMTDILVPFTTDGSAVRADEVRNLIILAGGQRELKHLLETIDLFDVDFLAGMSVGLFPIKSTDVKTLVAEVDKVFGAAGNPLNGIVRVIPIERLNALLIVTTQPRYLDEAKKWIDRLDQTTSSGGGLHVYQVKNGKAESLAALLGDIFGGKGSSGSSFPQLAPGARPAEIRSPQQFAQPGIQQPAASVGTTQFQGDGVAVSKDVRVVADKDNNALLIIASQSDYAKIEQALRQLDVVPRQVLVEVLIAEVTLTDQLSFGIDWFINARNGTSNGVPNLTTGTLNAGGALPASPIGAIPAAGAGLQLVNTLNGDIRGILRAFGSDGKVQVLASPSIMVQDNQKATIKVGDRISVSTGSQTTGTTVGVLQTIQYLETGVLLTVQPRINASGQVSMEINQEVSSPSADLGAGGNPNVSTRSFQTSVTVNSGETMALAGLIRRDRTSSGGGVPLLSKIPVIGAAFGVQKFYDKKTELVVVITPQVVANSSQAQDVTNELRRKLPALESLLPKPKKETPPAADKK